MSQREKEQRPGSKLDPLEPGGFQQKALWESDEKAAQKAPLSPLCSPTHPPAHPPAQQPPLPTQPQIQQKTKPPVQRHPVDRRSPAPAPSTALLHGQVVPYRVRINRVRISAQARVLRLVIRQESGLEIVAPRGTRHGQIEEALQQKADWILRTMQRVVHETTTRLPPLENGCELPFMGRTLKLVIVINAHRVAGRPRVALTGAVDDVLMLSVAESECHDQQVLRGALEHWYRHQAQEIIPTRLATANRKYGFTYKRVTIKEQKSRWGSCSRAGNLNFNWRLLLAPLPVLDYVLIHELAHLKELNHAPKFWRLVASACPDYETQRRWLREHGRTLRF